MANRTADTRQIAAEPWAFQQWAFRQPTGNPARKAVLAALASMAGSETGRCEVKHETLATWAEISKRSVVRHLEALREMGLIASRRQHRRDGSRRGDEFLLLAPWVTEWPDGEPVQSANLSPSQSANSDTAKVPNGAGPKCQALSPQERPLENDHSRNGSNHVNGSARARGPVEWVGVPDEMRSDAETFLSEKRKVGGRIVTEREWSIAAAALAEFNRQLEARFELGPWFALIVARTRDHPSWDAAAHIRLVQSAFRLKWWERNGTRRRAKPPVIWSERSFPNVVDDATREAAVLRERDADRDLRGKVIDGVPFEEMSAGEKANLRESVAMGYRPWERDLEPVVPVPVTNGHHGSVNASNFLTADL